MRKRKTYTESRNLCLAKKMNDAINEVANIADSTPSEVIRQCISAHLPILLANLKKGGAPDINNAISGVYFFQAKDTKRIKIGYSKDIYDRKKQLESSEELTILHIIEGATRDKERELHKKFEHLKFKGEWFKDSNELLGYIKDLKSDK